MQSFSQQPRGCSGLWAIGSTRFSTPVDGEQLQCWESFLFPCSALISLLSAPFGRSQTSTGVRWCPALDTLWLLTFWSPIFICSWKVLLIFLGEDMAERCVLCSPAFLTSVCFFDGKHRVRPLSQNSKTWGKFNKTGWSSISIIYCFRLSVDVGKY